MKFRFGPPPETSDFTPDDSWQPLNEPGTKTFLWVVLPFGLFGVSALFILWFCLTDLTWNDFLYWFFYQSSVLSITSLTIGIIIVHELIHALFHPGYGLTSNTTFGLWLSKGSFYVHWHGEMSRNRAIVGCVSPFLVLSVLPLLVCLVPCTRSFCLYDSTVAMLCYISLINTFFASADLMGARMFFLQIPKDGIIRNKGYYTYWQINEQTEKLNC